MRSLLLFAFATVVGLLAGLGWVGAGVGGRSEPGPGVHGPHEEHPEDPQLRDADPARRDGSEVVLGSQPIPVDGDGRTGVAVSSAPARRDTAPRAEVRAPDRWPARRARAPSSTEVAHREDPAVAAELAFAALQYVGVDREAERTWRRAIEDPATPAGTRSDLIEDLNQEGYLDNDRPTADDLPLILARMAMIERLAPLAQDDANRAAFAEAYKDLLNMVRRLSESGGGGAGK